MDENAIWSAIDDHRLRLIALLEDLSDEEWRTPSLCPGWNVRDVAAHLTMAQTGIGELLILMIRIRGDLNTKIVESARRRAVTWSTDKIIGEIRAMVGSRRHNPGLTCRETLIDILVHSQDIAVPLDRRLDLPGDAAAEAADRCWTTKYFGAQERLRGFRLVATDVDWAVGTGAEVRAPIDALLLVLTGRLVALPRLAGPGAADVTQRLAAVTT